MGTAVRHVLGLSGGKDSTALAVYMRDKIPDMEYVFCDTLKELPETYEYLDRLEAYLGKPIVRLNADRGFDHWLEMYGGLLPSSQARWCTRMLKLAPFEKYLADGTVYNYVGLRADEAHRKGYETRVNSNVTTRFPFIDAGLIKSDIERILTEAGLGKASYYKWRSRSGCYFCFFQQKVEWLNLKREHPDLFELAKSYEHFNSESGEQYTWSQGETLLQLEAREEEVRAQFSLRKEQEKRRKLLEKRVDPYRPLVEVFAAEEEEFEDDDEEFSEKACLICSL